MRHLPDKTYNYTSVPPKIQRTGGTFRRHSEESSKQSLRNTLRKGFTTVLTGLPNHTEPKYTRRNITCRDYVCVKDTTSFWKTAAKASQSGEDHDCSHKKDITQETRFSSKPTVTTHLFENWEQSTKELETRHTSFWALPPPIKDTWTKSGGDG